MTQAVNSSHAALVMQQVELSSGHAAIAAKDLGSDSSATSATTVTHLTALPVSLNSDRSRRCWSPTVGKLKLVPLGTAALQLGGTVAPTVELGYASSSPSPGLHARLEMPPGTRIILQDELFQGTTVHHPGSINISDDDVVPDARFFHPAAFSIVVEEPIADGLEYDATPLDVMASLTEVRTFTPW